MLNGRRIYELEDVDSEFVKYYLFGKYGITEFPETDNPNQVRFIASKEVGDVIMNDEAVFEGVVD